MVSLESFGGWLLEYGCICQALLSENGRLKALLRSRGTPIPENDLWIAALAVQHKLTLVTRDSHFQVVAGLITESWTDL